MNIQGYQKTNLPVNCAILSIIIMPQMLISEIRARTKEKDTDMTVSIIIIAEEEF